ncbi:MAG: ribbon-helix-helix protein, CopG family [Candidatus Aegiribacteria sp.]|nr:ribbon-helix-helix protein, CopG family [Candidatus Aegiribacteria sp.]
MVRTQIYLTEEERDKLSALVKATGKRQSELIRDAVDMYIDLANGSRRDSILNKAAGMWRDRKDLPDFSSVRLSWDRS